MARSNECAPKSVPILIFFSMKKPSEKISPQNYIKSAIKPICQRKSLLLPCCQALKDGEVKWIRPRRCPHFEFFSRDADGSMNDGSVLKVSNTGTDNWKIRFNALLASCVSIENTHAPLLVYAQYSCEKYKLFLKNYLYGYNLFPLFIYAQLFAFGMQLSTTLSKRI